MIHILTGEIDSGKTRKLLSIFQGLRRGDGFLSKKIFVNGNFVGYELERLSTGEILPFAFLKNHIPESWIEGASIGPFSFSKEGFDKANAVFEKLILEKVEPIFLDEIGPLEIRGEGFHDVFKMLIASGLSAYVVIRTNCLDEAKEKFLIKEYDLIWIETRNRKAEN